MIKLLNVYSTKFYILAIIIFPGYMPLLDVPDLPLITITRAYIVALIMLMLIVYLTDSKYRIAVRRYPFWPAILVLAAALLVITLFSENLSKSVQYALSVCLEVFLPGVLVWSIFTSTNEIRNALKHIIIVAVMVALYGTFAYKFTWNPVLDYGLMLSEESSRSQVWSYGERERAGYVGRAQSIFSHPMEYGYYLVASIAIVFIAYGLARARMKFVYVLAFLLMAYSMLLTNSRTPLLFLIALVAVIWSLVRIENKAKALIVVVFSMSVLLVYAIAANKVDSLEYYVAAFISMLGSQGDAEIVGSSVGMRLEQLKQSYEIFLESPLFGHGLATLRYYTENTIYPLLRGGESFAFYLLIDTGLIGIFAYAFFYLYILSYFINNKYVGVNNEIEVFSLVRIIAISFLLGHLLFIFATGELNVFKYFIIYISLMARYMYLINHEKRFFVIRESAIGHNVSGNKVVVV